MHCTELRQCTVCVGSVSGRIGREHEDSVRRVNQSHDPLIPLGVRVIVTDPKLLGEGKVGTVGTSLIPTSIE